MSLQSPRGSTVMLGSGGGRHGGPPWSTVLQTWGLRKQHTNSVIVKVAAELAPGTSSDDDLEESNS